MQMEPFSRASGKRTAVGAWHWFVCPNLDQTKEGQVPLNWWFGDLNPWFLRETEKELGGKTSPRRSCRNIPDVRFGNSNLPTTTSLLGQC